MKIRPLFDRVLIKRLEHEEKSPGGIIIPDTAKEKGQEAKVVSVGSGKVLDNGEIRKPAVKEGDRILFSKYSGSEVKVGTEELLIIREEDILGIIED